MLMKNRFPKLHFVSEMTGSIGEISKDLALMLKEDFELTTEWDGDEPSEREILLSHFLIPDVARSEEFLTFKFKVLIQPIDGTSIKKDVVELINKYDIIITPANAGKNIMLENGVSKPIFVVPNYFKQDIFKTEYDEKFSSYLDRAIVGRTVIYHESTFHPRKGIEILYESYIKAFSDTELTESVVLLLKDSDLSNNTFERNERNKISAMSLQKKYKNPAKILKLSCNLNDAEMRTVWSKCDIYVSMAKMEGFGIPLLRMNTLKKPIVTLDSKNSGYLDYLNNDNAYLIPTKNLKAEDEFMWLYDKNTEWAVPEVEDCVRTLQKAFEDHLLGRAKKNKDINLKYLIDNVYSEYKSVIIKNFKII